MHETLLDRDMGISASGRDELTDIRSTEETPGYSPALLGCDLKAAWAPLASQPIQFSSSHLQACANPDLSADGGSHETLRLSRLPCRVICRVRHFKV